MRCVKKYMHIKKYENKIKNCSLLTLYDVIMMTAGKKGVSIVSDNRA